MGDVLRIQWNIYDEAFCKNSSLYLTVDYSGKHFILIVSQGYEYALIKLNKILVCCHLFHKKLGLQSLQIYF